MKKLALSVFAVVCAIALCACGSNPPAQPAANDTAVNQQSGGIPQDAVGEQGDIVQIDDFDNSDYNPADEEDWGDVEDIYQPATISSPATQTPPRVNAGATPLVIDPIDKPTPTPAPALTFSTFVTYDATKLRMSFQAPEGWTVDDALPDTYVLTNPNKIFAYPAQLTITSKSVSNDYSANDLNREVKNTMDAIRSDFTSFSPSQTAERTLFDKKGRYADFTATLKGTDIQVWGRVHAVTVNKTLVVVKLIAPREYRGVYKDKVYPKFRETVKFTR